ncbi:hypothetical protein Q8A73_002347 [Channa argus]|nr:hypothetical protein Q8A73_002347 [Channa argus]
MSEGMGQILGQGNVIICGQKESRRAPTEDPQSVNCHGRRRVAVKPTSSGVKASGILISVTLFDGMCQLVLGRAKLRRVSSRKDMGERAEPMQWVLARHRQNTGEQQLRDDEIP